MWNRTDDPSTLRYSKIGDYEIAVNVFGAGLEIYIKGYGHNAMDDGLGASIMLHLEDLSEDDECDPILYVWDNIFDEEPTQRIDLVGAREERRAKEFQI